MFDENEIIEFFNRIINAPELKEEEIETNVTKFYEYLALTNMCDEETLTKLSKIITCIHEIITIKKTIGYIDIRSLLLAEPDKPLKLVKKPIDIKHYNHYVDDDYVSGCGGRPNSTTIRRSNSCGGSSNVTAYTKRC